MGVTLLSSWAAGAVCLHALEFERERSFITWLFTAYDLMAGVGYSVTPVTVPGRAISVYLSSVGIVCIAVLTATLCSSSELDASEAWLISSIQRRAAQHTATVHGVTFVQKNWRLRKTLEQHQGVASFSSRRAVARARTRVHDEMVRADFQPASPGG